MRACVAQLGVGLRYLGLAALNAGLRLAVVDGRQQLTGADPVARLHRQRGDAPDRLRRDRALFDGLRHAVQLEAGSHRLRLQHYDWNLRMSLRGRGRNQQHSEPN